TFEIFGMGPQYPDLVPVRRSRRPLPVLGSPVQVPAYNLSGLALHLNSPTQQEDGLPAQGLDLGEIVRDVDQGPALSDEMSHPFDALRLEPGITNRQGLVDDQNIGID